MPPSTVVVVPCFNEAARLPLARFEDFLRKHPSVGCVFVDDGSTDATFERLSGLQRAVPDRVQVLALPRNAGKAQAVRAGVLAALERDPDHVGYWDADLSTPLESILDFRAVLDARPAIQLVLGARVVLLGRHIERRPLRHYLGRGAATLISLTLGMPVYDTQCGAKLFRATPLVRSLFDEPFLAEWVFDVELLARLVRERGPEASALVCELPLEQWTDVPGSKLDLRAYLRGLVDLARLYRRYLR